MADDKTSAGAGGEISEAVQRALDPFGRALNAACIYGPRHARTRQWMDQAHEELQPILSGNEPLSFHLTDGIIYVNGRSLSRPAPWMRMLKARMVSGDVEGFEITAAAGIGELTELLEALATSRPGELKTKLQQNRIKGVVLSQVRMQAVSESEVVVDESVARAAAGSGIPGTGHGGPAPGAGSSGVGVLDLGEEAEGRAPARTFSPEEKLAQAASQMAIPPKQFQNIIAFIKGGAGPVAGSGVSGALNRAVTDPEKLATLITQAAVVGKSERPAGSGETLADIVVGCLRRTLDQVRPALSEEPEEPGAPSAQKSLLVLERMVTDKLRALMGPVNEETNRRIKAAIREVGEHVQVDRTALRFMEARSELTAQEQRLFALIREKGPDAFKGTAIERGLNATDWQELVVQAGAGGGGGGGGFGAGGGGGDASIPLPQAISTLADVLGRFDELMKAEAPPLEQMRALVKEINATVGDVVEDAGGRMAQFEQQWNEIRTHRAGMEGVTRLMGRISELTQELLQPITVIKTVLNMLNEAPVSSEAHTELIQLANTSGDQLKDLMDRLLRIVGLPAGLSPDFKAVYGPDGKPNAGGPGPRSTAGS